MARLPAPHFVATRHEPAHDLTPPQPTSGAGRSNTLSNTTAFPAPLCSRVEARAGIATVSMAGILDLDDPAHLSLYFAARILLLS
jgi:hypothetical protein